MNKINILGTTYEVSWESENENHKLKTANGLCEIYSKRIVINDDIQNDEDAFERFDLFENRVLRHEIVHAFLAESGLNDYARDEELVDWIAMQYPKICKVFKQLGIEE